MSLTAIIILMKLLLLTIGVLFAIFGLLNIFSKRFYRRTTNSKKTRYDINIFSSYQRYLISRYDAGFQIIGIGVVLIALAVAMYVYG
jgi:hypothetical protein